MLTIRLRFYDVAPVHVTIQITGERSACDNHLVSGKKYVQLVL